MAGSLAETSKKHKPLPLEDISAKVFLLLPSSPPFSANLSLSLFFSLQDLVHDGNLVVICHLDDIRAIKYMSLSSLGEAEPPRSPKHVRPPMAQREVLRKHTSVAKGGKRGKPTSHQSAAKHDLKSRPKSVEDENKENLPSSAGGQGNPLGMLVTSLEAFLQSHLPKV